MSHGSSKKPRWPQAFAAISPSRTHPHQNRGNPCALWYRSRMAPMKSTSKKSAGFVLGRRRLEKISAVEGIETSQATRRMFAEFDRKRLSPEQRRKAIFEKHAKKA
jgi:hypothetical protein